MIIKSFLPEEIVLPGGLKLKPVIGGHLDGKPFLTKEFSGVDVTQNGWASDIPRLAGGFFESENALIKAEARRRKLAYRSVAVISRRLRRSLDLHGRPYQPSRYVFVEVSNV